MRTRVSLVMGAMGLAVTTVASADIVNSRHNFSFMGWSEGEICLPCHTPHHAVDAALLPDGSGTAPLWNHELVDPTTTYTLFDGTVAARDDALDAYSINCMSCHDGTVALDSYGGQSGNIFLRSGRAYIGTDLQDDHPIGAAAIYPLGVGWMNDPANWASSHGMRLFPMDIGGNIEDVVGCVSCHEPHQRGGYDYMLWKNNAGSNVCLTCHLK